MADWADAEEVRTYGQVRTRPVDFSERKHEA